MSSCALSSPLNRSVGPNTDTRSLLALLIPVLHPPHREAGHRLLRVRSCELCRTSQVRAVPACHRRYVQRQYDMDAYQGRIMRALASTFLAVAACTSMAQAADLPPTCAMSGVPLKFQEPVADLNGPLPVPDYFDVARACNARFGMMPTSLPPPPENEWLANEAEDYSALLARTQYEWLIVPTQTQYKG